MLPRIAVALLLFAASAHAQWREVHTGVTASLRGLAIHGKSIWASGSGGTWLRSADDGKTWTHGVVAGAESQDFRGVAVLNKKTVLLMSSGPAEKGQAHIYRTADAGGHWSEVFRDTTPGMFLDAIKFWDAKHGIVLSDPVNGKFAILLSDDGGKTWHQAPSDHMPVALPKEGAFAASNSALAVFGKADAWFGTGGAGHGRVFHTTDRGISWTVADTPIAAETAGAGVFTLYVDPSGWIVAAGGDYQRAASSTGNMALSIDRGRSWTLDAAAPSFYVSDLAKYWEDDLEELIVVGSAGWAASYEPKRDWQYHGTEGFNAAACNENGICWAIGAHGAVATLDTLEMTLSDGIKR